MWRLGGHRRAGARHDQGTRAGTQYAPEPRLLSHPSEYPAATRADLGKAWLIGAVVGVAGTLGVQYTADLASKIHLGTDKLAYVTNVAGLDGPIVIHEQPMRDRLDAITGVRWRLQVVGKDRSALATHLDLPDQAAYPVDETSPSHTRTRLSSRRLR